MYWTRTPLTLFNFFYKQHFFPNQPQCYLTFSWIELEILLRCCLIRATIIIPRHILYLVYLDPFPGLGIFTLYLCNLFLIFNLSFIAINSISSLKQTHLFFCTFFRISYVEYLYLELLSFCLIFCQFEPEVAWKSVAYKKSV